ncbi:MAG: flagellar FliJ family protein [Alphaproteobacteria bacterium]
MKKLGTLIRLHRWNVDQARRKLADLEKLAADLRARAAALEVEMASERRVAGTGFDAGRHYGAYAAAAIERRSRLSGSLADLETEMARARDELAGAFEELKRFEITAERRTREETAISNRLAQKNLDDVAILRHRRGAA